MPDNLKTGVDKPDLYDPKINKAYAELATHYGALVNPARALKPKDKLRAERPMPYIRDSFWCGREFTSIEHMQAEAVTWAQNVAGQRPCRPLGGAAPDGGLRGPGGGDAAAAAPDPVRAGPLVDRDGSARTFTSRSAAPSTPCPEN